MLGLHRVLILRGVFFVTVCIATLFRWNYTEGKGEPNYGFGAITASDRMITAADVQYEPQQKKVAFFGRSIVLVAGDLGIHSQAIRETEHEIRGRQLSPHDVALIYGRKVQGINRRQAANEILAPLGLNSDTFQAQQKDLSESFVNTITAQLQNRRPIDIEALVVGSDEENAQIYHVDPYGNDTCLDGVGFGAIGIGAWHAKSRLMQVGHTSSRILAPTLASIFAAKKNAEIAPGVGLNTDMHIVLKDRIFPIWENVMPEMDRLYTKYRIDVSKFGDQMIQELQDFIVKPASNGTADDTAGPGTSGADAQAQADERASQNAAKSARANEDAEEAGASPKAAE
jgi:hypothetical protein